MSRRARLGAPGKLRHVIMRGIEKRKIVNDRTDRKDFVRRLAELAESTDTAIYAWALITNHTHILLRSLEFGFSGFMRCLLRGCFSRGCSASECFNRRHIKNYEKGPEIGQLNQLRFLPYSRSLYHNK